MQDDGLSSAHHVFAIHYIMQVVATPPPHEDLSLRNKKWHDGKISLSA